MTDERNLTLPDTRHVRWWWTEGRQKGVTMAQSDAQFDAWLAAHDAQVKADALEEVLKVADENRITFKTTVDCCTERRYEVVEIDRLRALATPEEES